ncbi:hypothetical protein K440DRAFT_684216 [Wilcoxina mikolae CBS 423.85]|nr:hypothetical protein K440DRAFT_684216 [Wilcoxina mikolae CBS 423.85]
MAWIVRPNPQPRMGVPITFYTDLPKNTDPNIGAGAASSIGKQLDDKLNARGSDKTRVICSFITGLSKDARVRIGKMISAGDSEDIGEDAEATRIAVTRKRKRDACDMSKSPDAESSKRRMRNPIPNDHLPNSSAPSTPDQATTTLGSAAHCSGSKGASASPVDNMQPSVPSQDSSTHIHSHINQNGSQLQLFNEQGEAVGQNFGYIPGDAVPEGAVTEEGLERFSSLWDEDVQEETHRLADAIDTSENRPQPALNDFGEEKERFGAEQNENPRESYYPRGY